MTLFLKKQFWLTLKARRMEGLSHSFRKEIIAHLLIDLAEVWSWFTAIFQRKLA